MNHEENLGRTRKRLLGNHIPLCVISGAMIWLFYALFPSPYWVFRLSISTGYAGLFLLAFTLLTGPHNVLRGRANPISSDLRRDAGIWAGLISLVHVGFGINVHFGSKIWPYFFAETGKTLTIRTDLFGFANHTGLVSALVIIVLLLTSNDLSIRLLGQQRWKIVQYTNYAVFVLAVYHAFAYQAIEKRATPFIILLAVLTLVVLIIQSAGILKRLFILRPAKPGTF
jgi:methionine sulfoxide reductase heme-binding subunit